MMMFFKQRFSVPDPPWPEGIEKTSVPDPSWPEGIEKVFIPPGSISPGLGTVSASTEPGSVSTCCVIVL